ncbi:MAG: hypothetical protein LIP03_01420 [Bacteroidales bacterium]|nr:hypothetical protein [Bacteroidales bacterium]
MNDNQQKSLNGNICKTALLQLLQQLQNDKVIETCTMEYRNGYAEYDPKQFYAPFYIEFRNGEGWLLFSSNSVRTDRMNIQQWNSYHIKVLAKNIKKAYLVIPDEMSVKEKDIALSYHNKIIDNKLYSAIEGVYSHTEMIQLIKMYSKTLKAKAPASYIHKQEPHYALVAEDQLVSLLIGCYRSEEQLRWILKNAMYNVRLKSSRGAVTPTYTVNQATHLLLYNQKNHSVFKYFTFKGKIKRLTSKEMNELEYPHYHDNREYLLYTIDQELSAPRINVDQLIEKFRPANWIKDAPVYVSFYGNIEQLKDT